MRLGQGEPSVYGRETARPVEGGYKKKGRQVAGKDYTHSDLCQASTPPCLALLSLLDVLPGMLVPTAASMLRRLSLQWSCAAGCMLALSTRAVFLACCMTHTPSEKQGLLHVEHSRQKCRACYMSSTAV